MRRLLQYLGIALLLLVSGCATRPKMDSIQDVSTDDAANFEKLYKALDVQIAQKSTQWKNLEGTQWDNAEWTAGGGGVTALAVLARSTPTAVAGAMVAGFATVDDRFFGTNKQNLAWTKAAHALQCMKGISTPLYVNYEQLSNIEAPESKEGAKAYVRRVLYDAVWQVNRTLEDRLRIGAISTEPDWNAFSTSIQNAAKSQKAPVSSSGKKILDAKTPDETANALIATLQALVGRYKADLATCTAAN